MKDWQIATLVKKEQIAENVMSMTFSLPNWQPFRAGQHYDIRLTAPNGYQAERSYSIASAPEDTGFVEFGIQLLENGEVSPYLWKLEPGRQVEMRGPIGGHFIWDISIPGPLFLIGGGTGMVPLMSMLRHHANHLDTDEGREIVFLISVRSYELILFKRELEKIGTRDRNINVVATITDDPPPSWSGYKRRVDETMLEEILGEYKDKDPKTFICGPTPFVEAVASHMKKIGFKSADIKTERFGG